MLSDLDLREIQKTDDGDDETKKVKCSMANSDHLGRYLIYIICERVCLNANFLHAIAASIGCVRV